MRLSAPIFQLKRRARLIARESRIPLHAALDKVARAEGFETWSLLASRFLAALPSETVLPQMKDGDLFILGARPGHGKTMLGLQLLIQAAREGRKAMFYTLDLTEMETRAHLRSVGMSHSDLVEVFTSDEISAEYIIARMSDSPRGTIAVIDYLQILDQQRSKPALSEQLGVLQRFARETGVILGFISQIDRSYDPSVRQLPGLEDVRLPNPLDLALFDKACFLHDGKARMKSVGF